MDTTKIAEQCDQHTIAGQSAFARSDHALAAHHLAVAAALSKLLLLTTNNPHYEPSTGKVDEVR